MQNEAIIKQMREYAEENNVPIMTDEGIQYLLKYIQKNSVYKILEIGTAIGYSAIMMCSVNPNIIVTTIERDEKRYLEALKNIKKLGLEDRIELIYHDALEVQLDDQYDLLFIDAAKAQNQRFFEKFERNLKNGGTIITDNMKFHGLVDKDPDEISSRNLRQLVRKVKDYIDFLNSNTNYETTFLDIGDGLAVSRKKDY
jgi:predicted O-methyltransferase YrrM